MLMEFAAPIIAVVLAWWLGTGLILYLDGLDRSSYRWSMTGATAVLGAAFYYVDHFSAARTELGAYAAFASALFIWAWLEMSFLMGYITGPRRAACPPGVRGTRRAVMAVEAILYHELAVIFAGAAILALTWNAANQVAAWTFVMLWAMRLSAKLNLFFGVRNRSEEFLPDHLKYLATYFARKPINLFFPVSMGISVTMLSFLIQGNMTLGAQPYENIAHTLLAALMGLAILEHIFMVVPVSLTTIWGWCLNSRGARAGASPASITTPGVPNTGRQAVEGKS